MNFNSYSIGLILCIIFLYYLSRWELSTLSPWRDLSMIDRGGTDAEL